MCEFVEYCNEIGTLVAIPFFFIHTCPLQLLVAHMTALKQCMVCSQVSCKMPHCLLTYCAVCYTDSCVTSWSTDMPHCRKSMVGNNGQTCINYMYFRARNVLNIVLCQMCMWQLQNTPPRTCQNVYQPFSTNDWPHQISVMVILMMQNREQMLCVFHFFPASPLCSVCGWIWKINCSQTQIPEHGVHISQT